MKTKLYLLALIICLGGSLIAQPYSKPPYLYSDISASGNYDFTGKKFYISTVNYNAILPSDYNSQKEAFARYLEESLILRGATPATDSLNADFYVVATVDYWNSSMDVTKAPRNGNGPLATAGDHTYYLSGYDKDMVNNIPVLYGTGKEGTYTPQPMNSAHSDKGENKYPARQKNEEQINKAIIVEAYELADGTRNNLWITQALDSRGDFKFLAPDCAMVYLMMRAYGNDMKMRKCLISDEDSYYALFADSNMPDDIHFLPYCQSTNNNLNLFLVKKSDEGLVCLVEDNNLLSMDFKHKNYSAAVKIGNRTINSSKVFYDVRPPGGSRFLTLVFPVNGEDFQSFDIFFSKKNKPEKTIEALTDIRLN